MHQLADVLHRVVAAITPIAESLGGPGLALLAFLDSSFLSLPEVADALLVILSIQHPGEWVYLATITTIGSVIGCYAIYALAQKGGEAFLRRRISGRRIDRGLALFHQHSFLALVVPALLPPPAPFKLFVLLAGVAGMRPRQFLVAIVVGRGFRFFAEAWLAYKYGDHATQYIHDNLPTVSLWLAGLVVAGALGTIVWRRRVASTVDA
jgi:membrane protein YqaA with SNARE-associated domain